MSWFHFGSIKAVDACFRFMQTKLPVNVPSVATLHSIPPVSWRRHKFFSLVPVTVNEVVRSHHYDLQDRYANFPSNKTPTTHSVLLPECTFMGKLDLTRHQKSRYKCLWENFLRMEWQHLSHALPSFASVLYFRKDIVDTLLFMTQA